MRSIPKIRLADFLFKSLMVVLLIAYTMVFYTAIRFSFLRIWPDGIYRVNHSMNKKEWFIALSVTYIIIILHLYAFLKSRVLLDFCSVFIKNKIKKLYIPIKILFISTCIVLVVFYVGIFYIVSKINVVIPDPDIDIAKSAVEISYHGIEDSREIYNLCVKLWCVSDSRLSMQKNLTITLGYEKGMPVTIGTKNIQLYTSGRSMSEELTWDDLGVENKCNNELVVKWDKEVIDINIYGKFFGGYYIGVSPLIKSTLPFMFFYQDGYNMFYWESENLFTTVPVPFDAFITAKEYGTYSFTQDYRPFDYEFAGYNIDLDKNNVRKFTEGSIVCVNRGSTDYYDTKLCDYVYDREYRISQLDENRAVLMYGDQIVAAVNVADLYFAKEF